MTDTDITGDPFLCVLGEAPDLPDVVRALHTQPATYSGMCDIERGRGIFIALLLSAGRFPPSGKNIPVILHVKRQGGCWQWSRDFRGHKTRSNLFYDAGRDCVQERLGGLCLWLKPVLSNDELSIEIIRLTVFGLPCPRALLPRSATIEWQDGSGRFRFDVSARVPLLGQLIRYQGWLVRDHTELDVA